MKQPSSTGPMDVEHVRFRVIAFDADGGAPAALRRLAAVLETEDTALHNVWLGAPLGDREQLVFVTLRPLAEVAAARPAAPARTQAAMAEPCAHEWDTSSVLAADPPQLRCRLCGALSGTLAELTGAR